MGSWARAHRPSPSKVALMSTFQQTHSNCPCKKAHKNEQKTPASCKFTHHAPKHSHTGPPQHTTHVIVPDNITILICREGILYPLKTVQHQSVQYFWCPWFSVIGAHDAKTSVTCFSLSLPLSLPLALHLLPLSSSFSLSPKWPIF